MNQENRHKLQSKLLVCSITIASNQSFESNCFFYSLFSQIRTTQSKLCLHKCGRAFLHTTKDDFYNEGGTPYIGKKVRERIKKWEQLNHFDSIKLGEKNYWTTCHKDMQIVLHVITQFHVIHPLQLQI